MEVFPRYQLGSCCPFGLDTMSSRPIPHATNGKAACIPLLTPTSVPNLDVLFLARSSHCITPDKNIGQTISTQHKVLRRHCAFCNRHSGRHCHTKNGRLSRSFSNLRSVRPPDCPALPVLGPSHLSSSSVSHFTGQSGRAAGSLWPRAPSPHSRCVTKPRRAAEGGFLGERLPLLRRKLLLGGARSPFLHVWVAHGTAPDTTRREHWTNVSGPGVPS